MKDTNHYCDYGNQNCLSQYYNELNVPFKLHQNLFLEIQLIRK